MVTPEEEAILLNARALGLSPEEAIRRLNAQQYTTRPEPAPLTARQEEWLASLCKDLGFNEAFNRLIRMTPPRPSGIAAEPEPEEPADDQEQEQEEDGEREPGHSDRPLCRGTLTFTAPRDDVYAAESVTIECIITHERMEGLATMRDLPEHDQAGWRWWGFGNFEVGVRPTGD
jgi:hypothetical protein